MRHEGIKPIKSLWKGDCFSGFPRNFPILLARPPCDIRKSLESIVNKRAKAAIVSYLIPLQQTT